MILVSEHDLRRSLVYISVVVSKTDPLFVLPDCFGKIQALVVVLVKTVTKNE
jgi:hypothetical protein